MLLTIIMSMTRIGYLDAAKVVGTFLVILGHLYSGNHAINQYIYGFHVPLFFIISGVFHKFNHGINVRKYVYTLLWPTFVFIIVKLLYYSVFSVYLHGTPLDGAIEFCKVTVYRYAKGYGNGVYWFLVALFWCKVMADFFLLVRKKWIVVILWFFMLFVPYALHFFFPLMISQALMALPFFLLGFWCKDVLIQFKPSFYYTIPATLLLAFSFFLSYCNGKVSMLGVMWGQLPAYLSIPVFYLNGITGSMGVICLCLLFRTPRFVGVVGMSLLSIIGFQRIFYDQFTYWNGFDNPLLKTIPVAIVILVLCCFAHRVFMPIYNLPIHVNATLK